MSAALEAVEAFAATLPPTVTFETRDTAVEGRLFTIRWAFAAVTALPVALLADDDTPSEVVTGRLEAMRAQLAAHLRNAADALEAGR